MAFIKTLIGLPVILIIIIFAFVNNDFATFVLWPGIKAEVSLSVVIVVLVFLGFLLGHIFSWMSYAPLRKELRSFKKNNKKLSKEQEKLTKEVECLQSDLEEIKHDEELKNPKTPFFQKLNNIFKKRKRNELVN